jgi:hypothetical protein
MMRLTIEPGPGHLWVQRLCYVSGEKVLYFSTRKAEWIPAKITDLSTEWFKIEGRTTSLPA